MSCRFETKHRPLVVTLWELVEAATSASDDPAEVAAVVEHILRTRARAAPGVAGEPGLARRSLGTRTAPTTP